MAIKTLGQQQCIAGSHRTPMRAVHAMQARPVVPKAINGRTAPTMVRFSSQRAAADKQQQQQASSTSTVAVATQLLQARRSLLLGGAVGMASCVLAPLLGLGEARAALDIENAQQVAAQIEKDFVQGQYYITGALTQELYEPDCRFTDPTTDVRGTKLYSQAVALLFDPAVSKAELISIKVVDAETIKLRWRLEGALRIGNLKLKPYTGTTVYHLKQDTGRITYHEETWDISAVDAFASTLFPNSGALPAPPIEELRKVEGVV